MNNYYDEDDEEIVPVQVVLESLNKAKIEDIVIKELRRGTPLGWITFYLGDEDHATRFSIDDLVNLNRLDPKILEIKPQNKTSPTKEKTFINPTEKLASGIPIFSSLDSMLGQNRWEKEERTNLAYYEYHGKKNPNNQIRHYISNPDYFRLLPFNEAIQIIDKLGVETAKVHLIFSIHASQELRPWESSFRLQGTKLIKDLNYDKRTDLKRSELLLKIAQTAWILGSFIVEAEWQETKGPKIVANVKTSRLWNVSVQLVGQKDAYGKISEPEEIYLDVTSGLWTESFLNQWGKKSETALYHYSYISKKIMSISEYPSDLALKIAMRQSIMHYRKSPITVRKLLIDNMDEAKDKISRAINQPKYASELKQQWNNALLTLKKAGFQFSYDETSYPVNLRPESKERSPRKYFKQLIQAKIRIIPPKPQFRKHTVSKPSKKTLTSSSQKEIITGMTIRQAREKASITVAILAKYMRKSSAWLSQKETGKRSLTQKEGKKLIKAIKVISKKKK